MVCKCPMCESLKEKLAEHCSIDEVITYKDLKCYLGKCFHPSRFWSNKIIPHLVDEDFFMEAGFAQVKINPKEKLA